MALTSEQIIEVVNKMQLREAKAKELEGLQAQYLSQMNAIENDIKQLNADIASMGV